MTPTPPLWLDLITAFLVVLGGFAALVGTIGLLRLKSFFQRIHAPTMGATLGTWCFALATVAQVTFVRGQLFVHALLIPLFIALTAPITTIFLTRAVMFRENRPGVEGLPDRPASE